GSHYATLSIIYPLIEVLKFTFAEFKMTSDDQDDEQDTPNFRHEELLDDNSNNLENDTSELTNNSSQNTSYLIKSMHYIIYNSLFDYWNKPIMVGLLAMLLDLWLKMLSNWDPNTQKRAKA
ncbi:39949_t:CDS:2, partial [Gigaspora margarita]